MKSFFIGLMVVVAGFVAWDTMADSAAVSGSNSGAVSGSQSAANNANSVSGSESFSGSNSNSNSASTSNASNNNQSGAYSNVDASADNAVNSTQGNTQVVNFNSPGKSVTEVKGTTTVKSAPGVSTGNVFPTAPCMGGSQIGLSGLGWGVAGGTTWKDDECGIRETARSFNSMGMNTDAVSVLCQSEYAKAAPACGGMTVSRAPATSAPAPVVDQRPAAIVNDRKTPVSGRLTSPEKVWVQ